LHQHFLNLPTIQTMFKHRSQGGYFNLLDRSVSRKIGLRAKLRQSVTERNELMSMGLTELGVGVLCWELRLGSEIIVN
jgi:hypothetical protein